MLSFPSGLYLPIAVQRKSMIQHADFIFLGKMLLLKAILCARTGVFQ